MHKQVVDLAIAGSASTGGGGSGAGSINIFSEKINLDENLNISSCVQIYGGIGGTATGGTSNGNGGTGGTGSCNIGLIVDGTYQSYYSNN